MIPHREGQKQTILEALAFVCFEGVVVLQAKINRRGKVGR